MTFKPFRPGSVSKKSFPRMFFLWIFLAGALLFGLSFFFLKSDFFRIKEISFKGNKLTNDQEITAAIIGTLASESGFWDRLLGTDNIFFWHQPAAAGISARLPLLADLQVTTDWYSKKIIVEVKEREAAGVWCFGDSECFLFDRDGFLFSPAPAVSGYLILKVFDENPDPAFLGYQVLSEGDWRLDFFGVLEVLKNSGLGIDSVILKPAADQEWTVRLASGPVLKLSRIVPMAGSLASLAEKITALPLDKIEYIDLTVPNRLYYQ